MTDQTAPSQRKARADGQRNRELLMEAAKRVLTEKGSGASMDDIARAAGVGNGTLYRHFPNRLALIEAVCQADTRDLVDAATELAARLAPLEALRAWMGMLVDYLGDKRIVVEAVASLVSPASDLHGSSGAGVRAALTTLYQRAVGAGAVRDDIDPIDLMRAVAGVAAIGAQADWDRHARQMCEVLIDGLARDD